MERLNITWSTLQDEDKYLPEKYMMKAKTGQNKLQPTFNYNDVNVNYTIYYYYVIIFLFINMFKSIERIVFLELFKYNIYLH